MFICWVWCCGLELVLGLFMRLNKPITICSGVRAHVNALALTVTKHFLPLDFQSHYFYRPHAMLKRLTPLLGTVCYYIKTPLGGSMSMRNAADLNHLIVAAILGIHTIRGSL